MRAQSFASGSLAIGFLFVGLAWLGVWQLRRGTLWTSRRYLRLLTLTAPLGFVAVIAGWITTEAGRQPWTVQGLLRTQDTVSALAGGQVAFSLSLFIVVYSLLLAVFLWAVFALIRKGPDESSADASEAVSNAASPAAFKHGRDGV